MDDLSLMSLGCNRLRGEDVIPETISRYGPFEAEKVVYPLHKKI
jgi:hypothetical protein